MYLSASPSKKLIMSNFMALPLVNYQGFHSLAFLPMLFSIVFCLIAFFEILHMVWRHFNPDQDWQ